MFDWLGDIISGIGSAIGDTIDFIGSGLGDAIWNAMLKWLYEIIYGAIADFFEMMGNMGSEVFDLEWVQATVKLFTLFGWGLFVAGTAVAIFDVAIEYQCGRANIKTTALNILKGFFACSLIGIVPIELYKFCISLQNTFSHDLVGIASGGINESLSDAGLAALAGMFSSAVSATYGLLNLLCMIAFAYCVIKMFFANIKRGGILLIQIAVGSLYMFSVPRGYADGFNQWCKQVIAICLTAFMQTTLLFLGLMTFPNNMLLGLGIMLAANEVPRIAQQFGLDSSVRVNMMSVYLLPSVFSELHIRVQITGKHLICLGKAAVGFVVEQCLFKIEDLTVLHRVKRLPDRVAAVKRRDKCLRTLFTGMALHKDYIGVCRKNSLKVDVYSLGGSGAVPFVNDIRRVHCVDHTADDGARGIGLKSVG